MSFLTNLAGILSPASRLIQGGRALARGDVSGAAGAAIPGLGLAQSMMGRNAPTAGGTQKKMAFTGQPTPENPALSGANLGIGTPQSGPATNTMQMTPQMMAMKGISGPSPGITPGQFSNGMANPNQPINPGGTPNIGNDVMQARRQWLMNRQFGGPPGE